MLANEEIRREAVDLALRSFTDYSPSGDELVDRADQIAQFISSGKKEA